MSVPIAYPFLFPDRYPVTQGFGANPSGYAQFRCSVCGNTLAGHNGVDFGLPTGTAILACSEGTVKEVEYQEQGYGLHIHIEHAWGESIYAHLSQAYVFPGQSVTSCQVIGLSGWSGYVLPPGPEGAHLHFGVRVHPFDPCSSYCGYSDPMPLLTQVCDANAQVVPLAVGQSAGVLVALLVVALLAVGVTSRTRAHKQRS